MLVHFLQSNTASDPNAFKLVSDQGAVKLQPSELYIVVARSPSHYFNLGEEIDDAGKNLRAAAEKEKLIVNMSWP